MEKITRLLLLFIALFVGLQSYAQTTPYEYYDRIPTEDASGNDIYDEDSHPAWITTVDSGEWDIDPDEPGAAVGPNGQFRFGSSNYNDGSANSGKVWGTVSSPNFDVDKSLTLELDFDESNHAGWKNKPQITFVMTYKDAAGVDQTATVTIELALEDQTWTITPAWAQTKVTCDHPSGTGEYTFVVPFPDGYASDGHVKMSLRAAGGMEVGTGTSGAHNTIDVYGDNLVLRDDWDNSERLRRNAGQKMKKVTIVRSYESGWYTLSLPFDLTMKQFQRRFMAGFDKSNADNYTWKENTSAEIWEYTSFTADKKVMRFTKSYGEGEDAAVLKAGVPYLIYIPNSIYDTLYDFTRPGEGPDSEDFSTSDKVMVFTNITLAPEAVMTGSASTVEQETGYKFVSNLSKTDLSSVMATNQIYYLGLDGSTPVLKKPSATSSTNIKGFRAYFVSPIETGEAKPALLSFSEPTSIGSVEAKIATDERVYNMQGQYVGKSLKELPRGIYVVNHKKYVIK
ncbi:MAG: hypothetical protein J5953_15905 [Prevotella sp.]|nr:hypothetical protein [Prevotella sp.]